MFFGSIFYWFKFRSVVKNDSTGINSTGLNLRLGQRNDSRRRKNVKKEWRRGKMLKIVIVDERMELEKRI